MNHRFAELAEALDAAEVRYCVWKSIHKIEDAANGNEDLDLLVPAESLGSSREVMSRVGYVEVDGAWHTRDIGTEMYARLGEDGVVSKVHIHNSILFGNSLQRQFRLPVEEDVLDRRVRDSASKLWTADAYSDLCLYLTRHLVRKKAGRPVTFSSEWEQLIRFHDYQPANTSDDWFPFREISDFVIQGNELSPSRCKEMRASVAPQLKTFTSRSSSLHNGLAALSVGSGVIKRRLGIGKRQESTLAMGGFIVPFVGIDGAGKSSALERLSTEFAQGLSIQTIFLGSGQSGASLPRRMVFAVLGNKAKFSGHSEVREASKEGAPTAKSYPLYYKMWLLLCLFDKYRNLRRGLAMASKGHVVLADRWPQDQDVNAADGRRTHNMLLEGPFDRFVAKFESRLLKDAALVRLPLLIMLDVSAETSVERKPLDLTLEQATDGRARLRAIDWNADAVAYIDADQSIEEVDAQILASIQDAISGR